MEGDLPLKGIREGEKNIIKGSSLFSSWSSFRQESSPKTWIYRIASNLCLDKLRQAKRRVLPVDLSDPASSIVEPRETLPDSTWIWLAPDFGENPEEALIRKDTLQLCFIALLQTLPPRQRAVLILKDVFDWSSKQILRNETGTRRGTFFL
ncbi:RNA polymerase factor sigma C family protein [Paenibacillus sp. oral taxon 786 str. D14]|nr:RNA polymerase factor sigma C family protein [Paenibacillus sp. oral taxon 786 str. D14]